MSEDDEKKNENTPKRPSSRCGRRTHGKPRVLRAVRRAVQATVVLEKHCVNLLDTKLVVGSEQDVFRLKKCFGGSGASFGRLPSPRRGSASPWDPSVSSLLVDVGGVGYPLSPLWGAGVEATFALHRGFAISFFETATFPFFPEDRNSREMGEKGPGSRVPVVRMIIWGRKKLYDTDLRLRLVRIYLQPGELVTGEFDQVP